MLQSIVSIKAVTEGIDKSYRDIDICMNKFHVGVLCNLPPTSYHIYCQISVNMELHRSQRHVQLLQERSSALSESDAAEFRSLLQKLVKNVDTILGTKSPEAVESIMTSLQTVRYVQLFPQRSHSGLIHRNCTGQILNRIKRQPFAQRCGNYIKRRRDCLRCPIVSHVMLCCHVFSERAAPQVTGQIEKTSDEPVAFGTYNDIYQGWPHSDNVLDLILTFSINREMARQRSGQYVGHRRQLALNVGW
jgi:hypothetical protein